MISHFVSENMLSQFLRPVEVLDLEEVLAWNFMLPSTETWRIAISFNFVLLVLSLIEKNTDCLLSLYFISLWTQSVPLPTHTHTVVICQKKNGNSGIQTKNILGACIIRRPLDHDPHTFTWSDLKASTLAPHPLLKFDAWLFNKTHIYQFPFM